MFHVKQLTQLALLVAIAVSGCKTHITPVAIADSRLPSLTAQPSEVEFAGRGLDLKGFLYLPPDQGPRPAMVHLHGCSGFRSARTDLPNASYEDWAQHWVRLGFVVLIVDSFTPRGEKAVCLQRPQRITSQDRVADAYAALDFLAKRDDVRPDRIYLQGWSHGAATVLHAVRQNPPGRSPGTPRFRAAVAYYPRCAPLQTVKWDIDVPLLIQSGAADDWTPAYYCQQLTVAATARGQPVEIDVYSDAHHSFDRLNQRVRFLPMVAGGKGAHVGTHPAAREQSIKRTTNWVAAHMQ